MQSLVEYLRNSQSQSLITEGIIGDLHKNFDKMGGKREDFKGFSKDDIEKTSDACKSAYEKVKSKSGKLWDEVKDIYAAILISIDEAVTNSKKAIEQLVANNQMKLDDFEFTCAQVYANAIAKGTKAGKQIIAWIADKSNGDRKSYAMVTFLISALSASKAGLDPSLALEILTSAGFK